MLRPPPISTLFPYTTLFRSDVGIAVGSPRGLVVPILRDCDQMSFAEVEKRIADFGKRAQDGKLTIERSEEHTSELQSRRDLVCRLLLEKKKHETIADRMGYL